MRGVTINKGTVGASATFADNVCGLLLNGPAVAASGNITGLVNGTVYKITNVAAAVAMGIDAAYDSANKVRVYRHISEFFRMAGEGSTLYFAIGAVAKNMKNLIEELGQTLIVAANGDISYIGVAFNPPTGYTPVALDGMEQAVRDSIAPAQALHEWSWNSDRPVNLFLEGRGLSATGSAAIDLRSITVGAVVLKATHVSICIGQDWDYAETQDTNGKLFADVGTMLGTKASISCNRNIGEVESLNLSDAVNGIWLNSGLSNHSKIWTVDAQLSDYDTKGYVFGVTYTGISGVRWNGDHVCSPATVDHNGYMSISTIGQGATINKAARLLRGRLMPKIKSTVPVDSKTGLLPAGMVKYFENIGDEAFGQMAKAGEVSDGKSFVDPTSNLLTGSKALNVSFVVVPTASINAIVGTITLKTSI